MMKKNRKHGSENTVSKAAVSQSILNFFPVVNVSGKENLPQVPTQSIPTTDFPHISWSVFLHPWTEPLYQEVNDDKYHQTFLSILHVLETYGNSAFQEQEKDAILTFWKMSKTAQILYVRICNRNALWYYLYSVEYGGNTLSAAKELMDSGFALGVQDAVFGDLEGFYAMLRAVKKQDLLVLLRHLQDTWRKITGLDHVESVLPAFPKPQHNPIYRFSHLAFTPESRIKMIDLQLKLDLENEPKSKPKDLLVNLICEFVVSIREKQDDFLANAKVGKIAGLDGCEIDPWLKALVPNEFPALIALSASAQRLYHRIISLFSFFHPKKDLDSAVLLHLSESRFPSYRIDSFPSSLFQDSIDSCLSYDANLAETTLDRLHDFNLPKETEGKIANEVSRLAKSVLDPGGGKRVNSLEEFLGRFVGIEGHLPWTEEFRAGWRWTRVTHRCVPLMEKAGMWSETVLLLADLLSRPYYYQRRGVWWERLIIDTSKHLRDLETAKILVSLALRDPLVKTGKRVTIEKQASRFGFPTTSIIPSSDAYFTQYIHPLYEVVTLRNKHVQGETGPLYFSEDGIAMKVEEFALWWYSQSGWKGFHCENTMFRALFGVLMWPVLYCEEVEGVFLHPFQTAALDYKSIDFYEVRKPAFEREFDELRKCPNLSVTFLTRYHKYQGLNSAYIDWDTVASWGLSSLTEIISAIDRNVLLDIFTILAQDFKFTNHGLPDLLLWKEQEVKLVEVKSQNDRLADHQKLWIQWLTNLGMRVELFHVVNM